MATGLTDDSGSTTTTSVVLTLQAILEATQANTIELRIMNTYLKAIASGQMIGDDPFVLRNDADATDNLDNVNSLS